MINQFVLNKLLRHEGLSQIISSNKQVEYYIKENNPDWLNKGPWYNTSICSKLNGTVFEDYIRNARTYIYNSMCYITAHYKLLPTYVNDASSCGGISIPKNSTTSSL